MSTAQVTEAELSHDRANWLRVAKERDEIKAERDSLRAEVERLKPYVSKAILTTEGTMLCSPQVAVKYNAAIARAERAEAELATERARLDWVFRNCKVTADGYSVHDREDLGAAMKEDAK